MDTPTKVYTSEEFWRILWGEEAYPLGHWKGGDLPMTRTRFYEALARLNGQERATYGPPLPRPTTEFESLLPLPSMRLPTRAGQNFSLFTYTPPSCGNGACSLCGHASHMDACVVCGNRCA
jgi:hypothetical protein